MVSFKEEKDIHILIKTWYYLFGHPYFMVISRNNNSNNNYWVTEEEFMKNKQ